MADQNTTESKGFFQTLPGIFTGIAGLITALGGFLIIMNKVGCMDSKKTTGSQTETTKSIDGISQPPIDSTKPNKTQTKEEALNTDIKTKVSYSPTETKNYKANLTFKIIEAAIHRTGNDVTILILKIKCVNESTYNYFVYPDYIRIKIGEDKYKPDISSPTIERTQVYPNSFTNLEYNFELPKGTNEFQLLLFDNDSAAEPVLFKLN